MDNTQHLIQLEAVRKMGSPMDAFIAVNRRTNPDGIEIHPLLFELYTLRNLYEAMKRVHMDTYNSLKTFSVPLYSTNVILIWLKPSCLDKLSLIIFVTSIDLFVQKHQGLGWN